MLLVKWTRLYSSLTSKQTVMLRNLDRIILQQQRNLPSSSNNNVTEILAGLKKYIAVSDKKYMETFKTSEFADLSVSLLMHVPNDAVKNAPSLYDLDISIVEGLHDFSDFPAQFKASDDSALFAEGLDRILSTMDSRSLRTRKHLTEFILMEAALGKRSTLHDLSISSIGIQPEKLFEFGEDDCIACVDYVIFPLFDNPKDVRKNEHEYAQCIVFNNFSFGENLNERREELLPFMQYFYSKAVPNNNRCLNFIVCDGLRFLLSRIGPSKLMQNVELSNKKTLQLYSNWKREFNDEKYEENSYKSDKLEIKNYAEFDISREMGRKIFNILPFWLRGFYPVLN